MRKFDIGDKVRLTALGADTLGDFVVPNDIFVVGTTGVIIENDDAPLFPYLVKFDVPEAYVRNPRGDDGWWMGDDQIELDEEAR